MSRGVNTYRFARSDTHMHAHPHSQHQCLFAGGSVSLACAYIFYTLTVWPIGSLFNIYYLQPREQVIFYTFSYIYEILRGKGLMLYVLSACIFKMIIIPTLGEKKVLLKVGSVFCFWPANVRVSVSVLQAWRHRSEPKHPAFSGLSICFLFYKMCYTSSKLL